MDILSQTRGHCSTSFPHAPHTIVPFQNEEMWPRSDVLCPFTNRLCACDWLGCSRYCMTNFLNVMSKKPQKNNKKGKGRWPTGRGSSFSSCRHAGGPSRTAGATVSMLMLRKNTTQNSTFRPSRNSHSLFTYTCLTQWHKCMKSVSFCFTKSHFMFHWVLSNSTIRY